MRLPCVGVGEAVVAVRGRVSQQALPVRVRMTARMPVAPRSSPAGDSHCRHGVEGEGEGRREGSRVTGTVHASGSEAVSVLLVHPGQKPPPSASSLLDWVCEMELKHQKFN